MRTEAGKVVGTVRTPLNTPDFSSFLLQAQWPPRLGKIVGLANAGGDTANSVKQASEFGLVAGGQRLAALLGTTFVVNALGLDVAQGLNLSETFYWDLNSSKPGRFPSALWSVHEEPCAAGNGASGGLCGPAALPQDPRGARWQSA